MKRIAAGLIAVFALTISSLCLGQDKQPPATLRSLLLHELHTTHDKADWFVPINTAVGGLSAEQASWQPPKGGHSAGQLTYHLLFWNRRSLQQLKEEAQANFGGDNDETFTKFDDKQWSDIVKQLDQVMTGYEKLVESATDQQLAAWAVTIGNVCTHNAYHVGQIVYVRKLQGSWNPDKGVK
ncbi:MAG TPA: DinB family protein [Candidatus Sulfotelmatobacter sp.]|nr:DinB family protein [Candidatus Sulfotelmatobacter sp.]